jgi:protein SCO1/2
MPTRRELITGRFGARAAEVKPIRAPAGKRYGAEYFSNVTLTTHEGNKVRFYDDLIRGKIAVINMMYAQCEGICPTMTANLVRVQELLGERVGRDIFMYSITLLPEQDTPQDLREYAGMHGVKPGWLFLTGARADIQRLRTRLGFFDPNPVIDRNKSTHTGMVRIGNDVYDRWTMSPALAAPEQIVATINHVDKSVVHTSQKGVAAADSA